MNAVATIPEREVIDLSTAPTTAMTLAGLLRHVALVEEVVNKVMKEGTHYGAAFKGDTKKNLLKPGADKLCLAFQLSPTFEVLERLLPNDHREYRITCRLATPQGRVMGEGVGSCSTMENKYRWRKGQRRCPTCNEASIIQTKGGRNPGGYWCVPDKGGCGANFNPGDPAIEAQDTAKVENTDIADVFNTVLKIGKKRAYVDATITATAVSDLFTQDLEDIGEALAREDRKEEAKRPPQTAAPAAAAAAPAKEATQPAPPKAAPTAAPASTAAASKNGTSSTSTATTPAASATTTSDLPETMPVDAPKPACQAWHSALTKVTDAKFALEVWQESCRSDQGGSWQNRFDTLRTMTLAIKRIHEVQGEQAGRVTVADICREANHDSAGIQIIRQNLIRASEGEVATANTSAGPAVGDDEPPF